MILPKGHSNQYLRDYISGKIPMGKKLGCALDNHLVWKDSQLNIILGHDNVGKTYWMLWYYLALATNHDLTFTLFMDENHEGKIIRDLAQMYAGKPIRELTNQELTICCDYIYDHFKIVDNRQRYDPDKLLSIFEEANTDNYLIDPYNGLDTDMTYANSYRVLNELKLFTKKKKQTIYINAHPATSSGRRSQGTYPMEHQWSGHIMPPVKADIEGGKPFNNKADDFIILHRLTKHVDLWKFTMLEVDKIKDTDTGGQPTIKDCPVMFDYNFGLGFKVDGVDVIKRNLHQKVRQQALAQHRGF